MLMTKAKEFGEIIGVSNIEFNTLKAGLASSKIDVGSKQELLYNSDIVEIVKGKEEDEIVEETIIKETISNYLTKLHIEEIKRILKNYKTYLSLIMRILKFWKNFTQIKPNKH